MRRLLLALALCVASGAAWASSAQVVPGAPKRDTKKMIIKISGVDAQTYQEWLKTLPGIRQAEPPWAEPDSKELVFVEYEVNRISLYQIRAASRLQGWTIEPVRKQAGAG